MIILPSSSMLIHGAMLSYLVENEADKEESLLPIDKPK